MLKMECKGRSTESSKPWSTSSKRWFYIRKKNYCGFFNDVCYLLYI